LKALEFWKTYYNDKSAEWGRAWNTANMARNLRDQRRLNFDEGYCSGNEVNQDRAGSDSDSESEDDDAGTEEWPGFDELLDSKIGMI
jgi:hypothetical protein